MAVSVTGDRPRISNAENTQKPGLMDEKTASKPLKPLIPLKNPVSMLSIDILRLPTIPRFPAIWKISGRNCSI
ncbi:MULTISPECIES: hypothetical protein [unclassified Microcoleus]|uniref:hypothetical protein n=1 Tax=unclassified Microcoleus TaxID=2642155 RepID=UPI002FD06CC0